MAHELGPEIQRLRTAAGFTLRGFARAVGISAAHESDIERGRRMPSEDVLRAMSRELIGVGGSYDYLKSLDARIGQDLQDWAQRTPEVAAMLRTVRDSGRSPAKVLDDLRRFLAAEPARPEPEQPGPPASRPDARNSEDKGGGQ